MPFFSIASCLVVNKSINAFVSRMPLKSRLISSFLLFGVSLIPKISLTYSFLDIKRRINEHRADTFAFKNSSKEVLKYTAEEYLNVHKNLKIILDNVIDDLGVCPAFSNDASLYRRYKMVHALYRTLTIKKSFSDWSEEYPFLLRFIMHASRPHHPTDFDRYRKAERVYKKRFK